MPWSEGQFIVARPMHSLTENFPRRPIKWHVHPQGKDTQPRRGRKRVCLSCVSDATTPIFHRMDARASNERI
ncbi:hypothetical protein Y032_0044g1019 [Ancylostoma ceylanicum]|uniref:Uncharacterized protein n=1 Tax=Ancylostoma ceylanicum TaxID=53326 RepID=A0A016UDF5_9BILA|nr:hypothetical protein Y032_0044g1019 [Ancylostoma ceylanicum]